MKRIMMAAAVLIVAGTGLAFTQEGNRRFNEFLNGFQEATVVVATTATGTFKATINHDETAIDYVLTFKELEGEVRQAHIHIGHTQNQGAIVLWLCETADRIRIRFPRRLRAPKTIRPTCTRGKSPERSPPPRSSSDRERGRDGLGRRVRAADLIDQGGEDVRKRAQLQVPAW